MNHATTDSRKTPPSRGSRTRLVLAVLLGLGALLAFHVHGALLPRHWLVNLLWFAPLIMLVEWMRRAGVFKPSRDHLRPQAALITLASLLLVFLCSSAASHKWFFFLDWAPAGAVAGLPYRLAQFTLMTVLLLPFMLKRRPNIWFAVLLLLLTSQIGTFRGLWALSHGAAFARDDHPSMMFRIWETASTWPQLTNYSPYWNAGVADNASASTGLVALGLLLKPLSAIWPVAQFYTPAIATIFIILVPLCMAFSVRVVGGSRAAAWVGAILVLGVSQHFFLWLFNYGTVGALFSTSFLPLFSACAYRAIWLRRREWWLLLSLVASFVLLMMWPPCAMMAATVGLSALVSCHRLSRRSFLFLMAGALLGLLCLYRHLGLIFFGGEGDLFAFLLKPKDPMGGMEADPTMTISGVWSTLRDSWDMLVAHLHEVNPLILFMGLLGALVFPQRSIRCWFVPGLLTLALLTGPGSVLLPNLQLGRMAIALSMLAAIPAALSIERILRSEHPNLAILRAALLALLLMTGLSVKDCYSGKLRQYILVFKSQNTDQLVSYIREHAPEGSRVLFAGASVHAFGDAGHIAHLPMLTGREMMGCDYYHFAPELVEYDYPPKPFRESADSIYNFMQAYNVSLILTQNDQWIAQFRNDTTHYRDLGQTGRISAFEVLNAPLNLFLVGSGQVKADFNQLEVSTAQPESRTVIRYNWQDGMRADGAVEIKPYPLADGFNLIEVIWNGSRSCNIRFDSRW